VPTLLRPALVALMVRLPTARSDSGTQLQAPDVATEVVQTAVPPALTVTDCPGTPVPVRVGRTLVVDAVPPAGGLLRATLGATQIDEAVLNTWPEEQVVQSAAAVLEFAQTGVKVGQSAVEPTPELPRHTGAMQAPVPTLQTCPVVH
jgi:hypothetical protein